MKSLLTSVKGNIYGLGVYCFKNATTDEILYVGSGMMNDRLSTHLYNLKRDKYANTNKDILQKEYNRSNLCFEVLHFSENNDVYLHANKQTKSDIQKSLETMEQFYVNLYKNTICNKIMRIRKTSSEGNEETKIKRRKANKGINNPRCKYAESLIANVIWLKENGYKAKDIVELVKTNEGVDLKSTYIPSVGVYKWINTQAVKPSWIA